MLVDSLIKNTNFTYKQSTYHTFKAKIEPAICIFRRKDLASSSVSVSTNQGNTRSIHFKGIMHKL